MAAHQTRYEAHAAANETRLRLRDPKEWKIEVWENLGWHYALRHKMGHLTLNPSNRKKFFTLFSSQKDGMGGDGGFFVELEFSDPQRAVDEQIELLMRRAALIRRFARLHRAAIQQNFQRGLKTVRRSAHGPLRRAK